MHIGMMFWSMMRSWGWKWTWNPHAALAITRTGRGMRIPKPIRRDPFLHLELVRTAEEYARARKLTTGVDATSFDAIIALMTFASLLLADTMAVLEMRQTNPPAFAKSVGSEQRGFPSI